MTATERAFLARKARYEQPAQSSGGKKGGGILDALFGLGGLGGLSGAIPVDAPQGPLPSGGNLNQGDPVGGTFSGGPGSPVIALGNPNREQIKIGPFFKPRVDPEAAARLAQDPLAPVQLEKPTTGVGGFFRRLLGDNANERNAARAGVQEQLRLQKLIIDQQIQGKMGLLDKEHQYAMERAQAASKLNNEETQYRTQLGLQVKQLENQWALQQEAEKARQARTARFDELTGIVGDPIKASMLQEQMLTSPLALQAAETADKLASANGTGRYAPKVEPDRWRSEGGLFFKGDSDPFMFEDGQFGPVGTAKPPSDLNAVSEKTRKMKEAVEQQNAIDEANAPGTIFQGAKAYAGDIAGSVADAAKAGLAANPNAQKLGETVAPLLNFMRSKAAQLRQRAEQEQAKKRAALQSQSQF